MVSFYCKINIFHVTRHVDNIRNLLEEMKEKLGSESGRMKKILSPGNLDLLSSFGSGIITGDS